MWKSSPKHSRIGGGGGARSAGHQVKNGRSSTLIGQPEPDAIRQFWETAMDGVESSAWEGIDEELWATARTSTSSNSSSSSSSSLRPARQGGNLLEAFKRKIHLSSGIRKASQNDRNATHDIKEDSFNRNSRTQDRESFSAREGEPSSDKLLEEVETLRRKLEKKDKEMQKLKHEVSTLQISTSFRNVEALSLSQAESGPQEETSGLVSHGDSFRSGDSFGSDSSQTSCLDFSFAPSTCNLNFEGKIKTKIRPASKPIAGNKDQPSDSIPSATAAVVDPRSVKTLSQINEGFALEEIRSTTKGAVSPQMQELELVDKYVEATKKSVDEFKAETIEAEDAAMYCHNHTGRGLKLPETMKEGLLISTETYAYEAEDEFFELSANASRSPPQSTSSTEEDDFEFPIVCADSNTSFTVQKAAFTSKVTDCVPLAAGRKSSRDLFDVEVDEKCRLPKMEDDFEFPIMCADSNTSFIVEKAALTSKVTDCVPLAAALKSSCVFSDVEVDEKCRLSKMKDDFEFPTMCADSNTSFIVQKAALTSKVTDWVFLTAGLKSSCALSDVEVDEKCTLPKMKGGEEVDVNAPTVILSNQTKDSSSKRTSPQGDPLKALMMNSYVILEADKLSKPMTSLRRKDSLTSSKHPNPISRSTPVLSPPRPREESLTTLKHSDFISRSTSVHSPPRSGQAAAQAFIHHGVCVSRRSLDSRAKAGNSIEQPRMVESSSNRNVRSWESIGRSERSLEPIASSDSFNFDHLPPRESHGKNSYGSTGPGPYSDYATTTSGRRGGLPPISPPTSPRARGLSRSSRECLSPISPSTSPRARAISPSSREGLLPISPPTSPRARAIPPSRYSAGSQLLREEVGGSAGWKPKSGSREEIDLEEEVRQILEQSRLLLMSDDNSGSEDERGLLGSRDKSFSVLALSRHRRSMEKNTPSVRHSPGENHRQQERPEKQEEQAIVLYRDDDAVNIQSSKVHAEKKSEFDPISTLPNLSNTVESSQKKPLSQLVWELEVQNSKNEYLSSLPRRSRFFLEANTPRISEVI